MTIRMMSLLAIAVLCFVAGVVVAEQPQQIEGRDITPLEYLWLVAIDSFRCSGALIGSRYVLTAGHCVDNVGSAIVEVNYLCRRRQHTNCLRERESLRVRDVHRHTTGDLALLVLDGAVNASLGIQPAVPYMGKSMHPSQKTTLSKKPKMKMIGAGREGTPEDISLYVKELDVKYMSPKKCRHETKNPAPITDTVVCSVAKNGNPCLGDSGSALVVAGEGKFVGRDVILAIHSFGPVDCSNARADQPLGHFRMSDAASLIQLVVCEGDYPEDWCEGEGVPFQVTASPTRTPTQQKAPSVPPTQFPTTLAPSTSPTQALTVQRTVPPSASPAQTPTQQIPPTPVPITIINSLSLPMKGSLLRSIDNRSIVYSVSFNTDGSQIVTGDLRDKVKVWSVVSDGAAPICTFAGHASMVETTQWSPSGKFIASGSGDRTVRVWRMDQPDEPPIYLPPNHVSYVSSVAWHPNGNILASGSNDNSVKVRNVESQEEVAILSAHSSGVKTVTFHPEGSQLASGDKDGMVRIWDATTDSYSLLRTLSGHGSRVLGVAYSPNGNLLASASNDGLRVWDVGTGEVRLELLGHSRYVRSVAWSPDGKWLVSGSYDHTVMIWDAQNGGPAVLTLKGHTAVVNSVDWGSDGRHVVSGSNDGTIKIWKLEIV